MLAGKEEQMAGKRGNYQKSKEKHEHALSKEMEMLEQGVKEDI